MTDAQKIAQEAMAAILNVAVNALLNIANTGGTVPEPQPQATETTPPIMS